MTPRLKDAVAPAGASIKEVMGLIDRSGLRVAYVTGPDGRLAGAVSDSEIRKAVLKGGDIDGPVASILNPRPVVLTEDDLSRRAAAAGKARELLARMPDSRFLLVLDRRGRPKRLAPLAELAGPARLTVGVRRRGGRRVLVVGGAGYLGSVLSRRLLEGGFQVRVLDSVAFGLEPVRELLADRAFELVEGDMRNLSTLAAALLEVDAVVSLAAIVGDAACKTHPELAIETNLLANKALAEACRFHQINRFLFASTCSVYGATDGKVALDEESPLHPVSLYARSKIHCEQGILGLADENFAPAVLRMATLYGFSPRMRFDLVANTMTRDAVRTGRIRVHGDGRQWRPLLHVEDAAEAFRLCLEAPIEKVRGQVFNAGGERQNYRILDIARAVRRAVPGSRLALQGEGRDARNYFVAFGKIRRTLGFRPRRRLEESLARIRRALASGEIGNPDDPRYYNAELEH